MIQSMSARRGNRLLLVVVVALGLLTGISAQRVAAQPTSVVVAQELCASQWTGVISYFSSGCPAGYLVIDLTAGETTVCWDLYTGRLYMARATGCQHPKLPLTLGGVDSPTLCTSLYTGAVRYSPRGTCTAGEVGLVSIVEDLLDRVTLDGVRAHQAALQAIADANNGHRTSGSVGYDASVDYARLVLEAAGYNVTVQSFDHHGFYRTGPSALEQTAPASLTYAEGVDYALMTETAPGDVEATVTAVDLQLGSGNLSTSGCEAADFAGFTAGHIALIQRGACEFQVKAENAAAAGAVGVIIFNQGNTTEREGLLTGTVTPAYAGGIPVMGATYALGVEWSMTPGLVIHMVADVFRGPVTSYNVLAESVGGDPDNVVMIGAHLDSVDEGPGIQDNGSGVAAVLEVAEQMAGIAPVNKLRFALWGAQETGPVTGTPGSSYYLDNLTAGELADISLYLNFDMIGSPNYVFFVHDGDDSDGAGAGPGPAGSAGIEALFESYYTMKGLPFKGTDLDGTSDDGPFLAKNIPTGGIFTGSFGIKTPEEAAIWGGTAGVQYDPCAHQACDTYANVSLFALDVNADAVAYATLRYAMSPSVP